MRLWCAVKEIWIFEESWLLLYKLVLGYSGTSKYIVIVETESVTYSDLQTHAFHNSTCYYLQVSWKASLFSTSFIFIVNLIIYYFGRGGVVTYICHLWCQCQIALTLHRSELKRHSCSVVVFCHPFIIIEENTTWCQKSHKYGSYRHPNAMLRLDIDKFSR